MTFNQRQDLIAGLVAHRHKREQEHPEFVKEYFARRFLDATYLTGAVPELRLFEAMEIIEDVERKLVYE